MRHGTSFGRRWQKIWGPGNGDEFVAVGDESISSVLVSPITFNMMLRTRLLSRSIKCVWIYSTVHFYILILLYCTASIASIAPTTPLAEAPRCNGSLRVRIISRQASRLLLLCLICSEWATMWQLEKEFGWAQACDKVDAWHRNLCR